VRRLDLAQACAALLAGDVVALPTDTVYGVAASIEHAEAIARLFSLKDRPTNVALPMLVASLGQVESVGIQVTPALRALAEAFWPGALTIVVAAPEHLARRLGASEATVGVRVPDDGVVREILETCGPLAVTSANVHGGSPCESAAQVEDAFRDREGLAGVLDGGERRGRVSSVVDVSVTPWRVLREGAISSSDVLAVSPR
jgi:tRNA threonylcarbamoyl adenosine modification protein (Sua5/YciO/YrdC/YwlC family)